MKKRIHIRRYRSTGFGDSMVEANDGGWVPYTDYCRMVSRLKEETSRLKDTIVKARMKEVGLI